MRYKYDPQTGILLITLSKEKADFGEQEENIIAHCNKKGKPIEIEILHARKTAVKIVETIIERKTVAATS